MRRRQEALWERHCAAPTGLGDHFFLAVAKMPVPLVWVAMAVWSQLKLLLVLASQPLVFGAFGWYWSSL